MGRYERLTLLVQYHTGWADILVIREMVSGILSGVSLGVTDKTQHNMVAI